MDGELLFLKMLANGLEDAPVAATMATIAAVKALQDGAAPSKMTCLLCDGERLVGLRHSGAGPAPALYVSRGPLDHWGALASEPREGFQPVRHRETIGPGDAPPGPAREERCRSPIASVSGAAN